MRSILITLCLLLVFVSAKSQKFQPGYFYDVKGTKNTGLINAMPRGKGVVPDEGYIEYKENDKAEVMKLSASDLRSFVAGRDSFVVAASPKGGWSKYDIDFVRVAVDAPIRLFVAFGNEGLGRSGFSIEPGVGVGIGSGGFGGGFGGGISIPLGRGGSTGGKKVLYFYGSNTAVMQPVTNENFIDIMSEVMGDEPDVVEKIQTKKFSLRTMDKLIAYFNEVQAAPPATN